MFGAPCANRTHVSILARSRSATDLMTQMAVPARIERASSGLTARYPTIRRRHHWWTYPNLHRDPELARFGCYYYTIRPLVALHGIAPCPPSCKDGILLSDPRAMVGGLAAIRTRTPGTPDRCTAIDTASPFVEWLLTVPLRVPRRVRSVSHFQTQEPNWWSVPDSNRVPRRSKRRMQESSHTYTPVIDGCIQTVVW